MLRLGATALYTSQFDGQGGLAADYCILPGHTGSQGQSKTYIAAHAHNNRHFRKLLTGQVMAFCDQLDI